MNRTELTVTTLGTVLLLVLAVPAIAQTDDFPLRPTYLDVPTISLEQLHREMHNVTIVDVRSVHEYDVIRIKGAVNIPVARATFDSYLAEALGWDRDAPVVFYCNGHTCAKSYKAARKALELGYRNAAAYDAGVFEWVKAYPKASVLLRQSPADLSKIISEESFRSHFLEAEQFQAQASASGAVVIDIREPFQRQMIPDFPGTRIVNLYMGRLVTMLESKTFQAQHCDKPLYILDAVGKQVRWLQYYLEEAECEEYYFLSGGVYSLSSTSGAS